MSCCVVKFVYAGRHMGGVVASGMRHVLVQGGVALEQIYQDEKLAEAVLVHEQSLARYRGLTLETPFATLFMDGEAVMVATRHDKAQVYQLVKVYHALQPKPAEIAAERLGVDGPDGDNDRPD